MSTHKAHCLLNSGTLVAHVEVNSHDGKTLAHAQSQLQFEVSVTEHKDAVKTRMFKQPEGSSLALSSKSPISVSFLVGWLAGCCV
jgi:hypothetical protein